MTIRYVTPDNVNTLHLGQQVHYLASPDDPNWRLEATATIIEITGPHAVLVELKPDTIVAGPKSQEFVSKNLFDPTSTPPKTRVYANIPGQLTY